MIATRSGGPSVRFAVEARGLTKRYRHGRSLTDILQRQPARETAALTDVSLGIEEGEVFGLLGPNGSGKTTFLKMLSTILLPTSGVAKIFGHDVRQEPRKVRQMVALVTAEERSLYWRLTGRQNLNFFASLYGLGGRSIDAKIDELLDLFVLRDASNVRVAEYSTGMRQKLAIARGLLSNPKLLFLDEPTRGLDPAAAHNLLQLVKERAIEHFENTVILTTHIAREVEQLCDRIATLDHGALTYVGPVETLGQSLDRTVTYLMTVSAIPDVVVERLRAKTGVISCAAIAQHGTTELELVFAREAITVSDILRMLLFNNVEILRCTIKERSLEETFREVFEVRGAQARSVAATVKL
jgi:ABC-2 type transport system ATP-binding protein